MRLHPRHRIDAGALDVVFAVWACAGVGGRRRRARRIEHLWSPAGDAVVCLSARSAFDLLLSAFAFPAGSEVLVSAVTIPDMGRIIRDHGLTPVPVELDPTTLAPRLDLLARLATGRTRAVLVAHLFGGRLDLEPVADLCRERNLRLIEDCAQSFRGLGDTGTPDADASLFSFGPIKTATAFGGGLMRVRDRAVLGRVRRLQDGWPVQTRRSFCGRVLRGGALVTLQHPVAYGVAAHAAERRGHSLDAIAGAARSSPTGPSPRRRPSVPLLAVLHRRLARFDGRRLGRRTARGEHAAAALGAAVDVAGTQQAARTWWLFPVSVDSPERLIVDLRAAGFDAAGATTALTALPAPVGRPEADPVEARRMLSGLVCLPIYPELPDDEFLRLLEVTVWSVRGLRRPPIDQTLRSGP